MQTIKHHITLRATLVGALLIIISAYFTPHQSAVQYEGDYYEYGPFRAYYDTTK